MKKITKNPTEYLLSGNRGNITGNDKQVVHCPKTGTRETLSSHM